MRNYIVVHSVRVCTEFVPETYGRHTTVGPVFLLPVGKHGKSASYQVCACRCGKYSAVSTASLVKRTSVSCGCFRRESTTANKTTHGHSHSSEYRSWEAMRHRCDNKTHPKHRIYGGRGIGYCDRWKEFSNFFQDIGLKPGPEYTLDRYPDKNGNYQPGNCRWADKREQANNTRTNRMVTINGKTDTLANWVRRYKQNYFRVKSRINRGWEPLLALTHPTRTKLRKASRP